MKIFVNIIPKFRWRQHVYILEMIVLTSVNVLAGACTKGEDIARHILHFVCGFSTDVKIAEAY